MTKEEYQSIQQQIIIMGNLTEEMDFSGALRAIDRSENVGHLFMAPLAYSAASPRLSAYRNCVESLRKFQSAYSRFKAVVGDTEETVARVRHLAKE